MPICKAQCYKSDDSSVCFKTPQPSENATDSPYMHSIFKTLEEVVDFIMKVVKWIGLNSVQHIFTNAGINN
jgi:cytochrome c peroxidase